jgi:GNAT superfamily N-acetyltransferase
MTGAPRFRPATVDDSDACFRLFWDSISDLAARNGTPWEGTADDRWPGFSALYGLLAEIAAEWWVAEDGDDGRLIGYARSIERGADRGLFELSEFFVRPGHQSAGVGRGLLERAFPIGRGEVRAIVATGDVRAVARYHRADTSIQFPILGLNGAPHADAADAVRLRADPITDAGGLAEVAEIEGFVLGYDRGAHELNWLLDRREAYRYRDAGRTVAFALSGRMGSDRSRRWSPGTCRTSCTTLRLGRWPSAARSWALRCRRRTWSPSAISSDAGSSSTRSSPT